MEFKFHMLYLVPSRSLHPVDCEAPTGQGEAVYTDNGKSRGSSTCYSPTEECNRGGANAPPAGDGAYVDTSWINLLPDLFVK
jgi:hypothetical protein